MRSWKVAGLLGTAAASVVGLAPRAALACSPALPVPEPTNPANVGLDRTPPVIVDVSVAELRRGHPYDPLEMDTCADIGWLWLDVVAEDDQTPVEKLRYRVQDLTADEPSFYYDEPVPWFSIPFTDDGKKALDFRLRIFVLDQAGNQGEPFDISVRDGESDDEGCSIAGAPGSAPLAWGWLPVALGSCMLRRRRVAWPS